jgi:predicted HAD superfamily Cof-like phosphohydrolase
MIDPSHVYQLMVAADQKRNETTARLYLGLMLEELAETLEAEGYVTIARHIHDYACDIKRGLVPEKEPDVVECFDGGIDLEWVTIGYMLARKFPIHQGWQEVARSNLSKIVDGVVMKNEYGKVIKPPSYIAPDMVRVLNESGYFDHANIR